MKKQMSLLVTIVLFLSIVFTPSYTVQAANKNTVDYWIKHKDTRYINDYIVNNKTYKCYKNDAFPFYTTADGKSFVKNKNTVIQLSKIYTYETFYKESSIRNKIEHIDLVLKVMKNSKSCELYTNIIGASGAAFLQGASIALLGEKVLQASIEQFSSPADVMNGIAITELGNSKATFEQIKKDLQNKKNLNSKYIDELIKNSDRANAGYKAACDLLSETTLNDVSQWNKYSSVKKSLNAFFKGLGPNWIDKMDISKKEKSLLKNISKLAKNFGIEAESSENSKSITDKLNELLEEFGDTGLMTNYFNTIKEEGQCEGLYNYNYQKTFKFYKANSIIK